MLTNLFKDKISAVRHLFDKVIQGAKRFDEYEIFIRQPNAIFIYRAQESIERISHGNFTSIR